MTKMETTIATYKGYKFIVETNGDASNFRILDPYNGEVGSGYIEIADSLLVFELLVKVVNAETKRS